MCQRSVRCITVTCPTTGVVLNPYSENPRFYYICRPNQNPTVYKCPGENEQFSTGVGCAFVCPAEGIYRKSDTSYYFCYRDGITLRYQVIECPAGTTFNEDSKRCELSSTTAAPTT